MLVPEAKIVVVGQSACASSGSIRSTSIIQCFPTSITNSEYSEPKVKGQDVLVKFTCSKSVICINEKKFGW